MRYVKPERILLRTASEYDEKWVQDRIGEDPSLLGLGDVTVRDKERLQPRAGRLDLLLQEVNSSRRYEVEIQLGKTDETHIIRTIEYWDLERKRYPQYEHTAVIVAEDITSRFLNVISLFNGFIPLIALQMQALRVGDQLSLVFTKVLDQMRLGLVDEDEGVAEVVDRSYWEGRATNASLEIVDQLVAHLHTLDSDLAAKYNKHYIGLAKRGRPNNFVHFYPRKEFTWVAFRVDRSDVIDEKLRTCGFEDAQSYDPKEGKYWLELTPALAKEHEAALSEVLDLVYQDAKP